MSLLPKGESVQIRDVWDDNLEEEFTYLIRQIVDDYSYVAMDTEFPRIVVRLVGNFKNSDEYHYQTLKGNVEMLKLIQLAQAGLFDLIHTYFPTLYDIKHPMKFCDSFHGGLNKLVELLEVERVGICDAWKQRLNA